MRRTQADDSSPRRLYLKGIAPQANVSRSPAARGTFVNNLCRMLQSKKSSTLIVQYAQRNSIYLQSAYSAQMVNKNYPNAFCVKTTTPKNTRERPYPRSKTPLSPQKQGKNKLPGFLGSLLKIEKHTAACET